MLFVAVALAFPLIQDKPVLQKGGGYRPPEAFESGASKWLPASIPRPVLEADLRKRFEALAASGRVQRILRRDRLWFPCVLDGLLSDDERIARTCFDVVIGFCARQGGRSPVAIEYFHSPQWRAGEFQRWSEWHEKNRARLAEPSETDLRELLLMARAGGGFDDPETQEGRAFGRIREMGPEAYRRLVGFIDHEDLGLGRATVTILNRLTGRSSSLPGEETRARIRQDWQDWVEKHAPPAFPSTELILRMTCDTNKEEVAGFLRQLADDDLESRERAQQHLSLAALRHAAWIREEHAATRDPEVRERLSAIVAQLPDWEDDADAVRDDLECLKAFLERLPPGHDDLKRRAEKLKASLQRP